MLLQSDVCCDCPMLHNWYCDIDVLREHTKLFFLLLNFKYHKWCVLGDLHHTRVVVMRVMFQEMSADMSTWCYSCVYVEWCHVMLWCHTWHVMSHNILMMSHVMSYVMSYFMLCVWCHTWCHVWCHMWCHSWHHMWCCLCCSACLLCPIKSTFQSVCCLSLLVATCMCQTLVDTGRFTVTCVY